jgi:hypothetical protein
MGNSGPRARTTNGAFMPKQTFEEFKRAFYANTFDEYRVTMHLRDIAGGAPADPALIEAWVNAKCKDKTDEERKKIVDATVHELPSITEEEAKASWCRFKQDEKGAFIEGRQLKAALKESANVIKTVLENSKGEKGVTALKNKVAECVFVIDERVYLTDAAGKPYSGALPTEERPIHVMTRQGPRTSLKRNDLLKDVHIAFTVRLAKTGAVSEESLFGAFAYMQFLGLGADRSQGRGQALDVQVEKRAEKVGT